RQMRSPPAPAAKRTKEKQMAKALPASQIWPKNLLRMPPHNLPRLLPRPTHGLRIRRTLALVLGEEQSPGGRFPRVHTRLPTPRHPSPAECGARAQEQIPLPALLVGDGEDPDERLKEEPDEPGGDGVRLQPPARVARVDPPRPRVYKS